MLRPSWNSTMDTRAETTMNSAFRMLLAAMIRDWWLFSLRVWIRA